MPLKEETRTFGQQLNALPDDKAKVKLLLKTINKYVTSDDPQERIRYISYSVGYLGSLLVRHNLNDFGGD